MKPGYVSTAKSPVPSIEAIVHPLSQKYFCFSEYTNQSITRPVPHPQEGRFAIVTDVGRGMRWTFWCSVTSCTKRTAKPCGPDAPTLASSSWEASWFSGAMVATKPGRQGEHGVSRKTIAQGMSDRLRCPVCSCAFFCAVCTRDRGCSAHPAFPAPSFSGARYFASPGRIPRRGTAEDCPRKWKLHAH